MALLSLDQVRDGLAAPSLLPQNLDFARQAILFLQLSREELRRASFLDDRIRTPQTNGRWVQFEQVAEFVGASAPTKSPHFIFHSGHVGSTMMSRLLDEADGVLGLREPFALRTLADAFDLRGEDHSLASPEQLDRLLAWFTVLWARGFADTKTVVVKATSSAARLHPNLLNSTPHTRAIYMNLEAENYLATLLAGANSHLDLRGLAGERMRRLTRLIGAKSPMQLHAMSLGQIAAMTWATERLTQKQAEACFPGRILSVDFDAFLKTPQHHMRQVVAHLQIETPDSFLNDIEKSAAFRQYSKAPEQGYTPQLRAEILEQSRRDNAREIRTGLQWLDALRRAAPHIEL